MKLIIVFALHVESESARMFPAVSESTVILSFLISENVQICGEDSLYHVYSVSAKRIWKATEPIWLVIFNNYIII
jgi:hypothetical protein